MDAWFIQRTKLIGIFIFIFSIFFLFFSKEQYLQAHCQFIVKAWSDLSVHEVDPDTPVSWDIIEEVHLKTDGSDPMSCPICLFPPTAG